MKKTPKQLLSNQVCLLSIAPFLLVQSGVTLEKHPPLEMPTLSAELRTWPDREGVKCFSKEENKVSGIPTSIFNFVQRNL